MSYTSKATINNQIYGWSHKIQKHKARSLEYEAFEMFTLTINDVFHREQAKPSAILNCDHSLSHLLLLAWFNILFCLPHIIILTIYKPYVCKYIPCSHCSLPEQFEKNSRRYFNAQSQCRSNCERWSESLFKTTFAASRGACSAWRKLRRHCSAPYSPFINFIILFPGCVSKTTWKFLMRHSA